MEGAGVDVLGWDRSARGVASYPRFLHTPAEEGYEHELRGLWIKWPSFHPRYGWGNSRPVLKHSMYVTPDVTH